MFVKQHGVKVRIYPNRDQQDAIEQNIGNVRFLWNAFLGMASESTSLQIVSDNLYNAFKQFFLKKRGYPNFKSKHRTTPSYTIRNTNGNTELELATIKLPKLGWMPARWSSNAEIVNIKRVTITRQPTGEYIASLIVESESQTFNKTGEVIGLDMGQTDLMIGSNGYVVTTKQYRSYENKLASWQRKAARRGRMAKKKDISLSESKNYQRAKQMVAKYHKKYVIVEKIISTRRRRNLLKTMMS